MNLDNLVWYLLIGLIAGFLAGQLIRGRGFGVLGNIIIGIVGALLGGFLFDLLNIGIPGIFGAIVMATVGALVLLFVLGAVIPRRGRRRV